MHAPESPAPRPAHATRRRLAGPLLGLALALTPCARVAAHGAVYPALPAPPPAPAPAPNPTAPLPPGPGFPTTPTNPGPASTGGTGVGPNGVPTGGPGSSGPATGGSAVGGATAGSWEWWWHHNQDRFLELRTHIDARTGAPTSESEFFGDGTRAARSAADPVAERVVPALLGVLARETQPDLVTAAMVALARLCDGPLAARAGEFGRTFARFSGDGSQEVAETAVLVRGLSGDAGAVAELGSLLAGEPREDGHAVPERTRAFAAYALGFVGARCENEDVRRYVAHHLSRTLRAARGATPDVAVACVLATSLTPLAWSEEGAGRVDAPANALDARRRARTAAVSRETQIETLLGSFADDKVDRYVRAHVPGALARLLHDAGAAPIPGAPRVDPAAVIETRRVEARAAVMKVLVAALATSNEPDEVRQGCILALGRIVDGDREPADVQARAALAGATREGDLVSRRFALIALAECSARPGPDGHFEAVVSARELLMDRLAQGKSDERAWAALALGLIEHARRAAGDDPARSVSAALVTAFRGAGSGEEAGALALACGLAHADDALEELTTRLARGGESRLRGHLALGLGLLGDARARPALRALLAEARFQPELLRATGIALVLLEDGDVTRDLIGTLRQATSQASQSAAATVLGWTGDTTAIEPLIGFLTQTEASATARAYAAAALGRVCDRDRLPWNAAIAEDVHYRAATVTLSSPDGTGLLDLL